MSFDALSYMLAFMSLALLVSTRPAELVIYRVIHDIVGASVRGKYLVASCHVFQPTSNYDQ